MIRNGSLFGAEVSAARLCACALNEPTFARDCVEEKLEEMV